MSTAPAASYASAKSQRQAGKSSIVVLLARLIVGGTLIYASLSKFRDPVTFLKAVRGFELVPESWYMVLNAIAIVVPWIEMLGGVILVLGLGLRGSAQAVGLSKPWSFLSLSIGLRGTALVILVMLVVFTTAISLRTWNLMEMSGKPFTEIEFDCGCGTGATVIWIKLLKNAGLILLTLFIVVSRSYAESSAAAAPKVAVPAATSASATPPFTRGSTPTGPSTRP